jgi:hypothetical protein
MSPFAPIDEMPTMSEVENADNYRIVCWHHYLRQSIFNDELVVIKKIAQRYDQMNVSTRANLVSRARREYES